MSVRNLLVQIKTAIENKNSIEVIGGLYKQLEDESTSYNVIGVSKPFIIQLIHIWLMQQFTGEMLRVSTSINFKQLEEYSVTDSIDEMILKIDQS